MVSIDTLREIPLLGRLDRKDLEVLAAQVDLRAFAPRERIFRMGEVASAVYLIVSGKVSVTTVDDENQEILLARPGTGTLMGLSSMLDETTRQTQATAEQETRCVELTRQHLADLVTKNPMAALDMLAALASELSEAQHLVRGRSTRHPYADIEDTISPGERLADAVARFGGSWAFILTFLSILVVYTALNSWLGKGAWDPYPFILLNLFLSMLAALQAPVIMMSQNRQDQKDRLRSQLDFEVNRKAEAEIRSLSAKVLEIGDSLDELRSWVRPHFGPDSDHNRLAPDRLS